MTAFPMTVAEKNVRKGMRKCPLVIPAKSNRGLGIEAHTKIAQNPYFSILLYMNNFAFSMRFKSVLCLSSIISVISSEKSL